MSQILRRPTESPMREIGGARIATGGLHLSQRTSVATDGRAHFQACWIQMFSSAPPTSAVITAAQNPQAERKMTPAR